MKAQSDEKPVKKRNSKRLYDTVKKQLFDKCDQICEEVDKQLRPAQELIIEESK